MLYQNLAARAIVSPYSGADSFRIPLTLESVLCCCCVQSNMSSQIVSGRMQTAAAFIAIKV